MTIRAVLFDKDGTLVDFDATWGPAGLAVMRDLAGDDAAALARLLAVADYDLAAVRFRPASPVVAGSTGDYGPSWADAVGRAADQAFFDEMDRLFLVHGLACLKPLGQPWLGPLQKNFEALTQRHLRRQQRRHGEQERAALPDAIP